MTARIIFDKTPFQASPIAFESARVPDADGVLASDYAGASVINRFTRGQCRTRNPRPGFCERNRESGMTKPTGNPNGRPPGPILANSRELKLYTAQYGTAAVDKIFSIMNDEKSDIRVQLDAAVHLLDRGYGKPAQSTKVSGAVGTYDLSKLTDEQLRSTYEVLKLAAPDTIGEAD